MAGVMLKPAMDVADGMVIFRDSFNQYGFLTSFIQAAAVKLFGGEVLVINLLTVVFYGLCAVELDRFWSRFLSTPFRWLMMGLFWGMAPFYLVPMHPWSSVYALYFMLLGRNADGPATSTAGQPEAPVRQRRRGPDSPSAGRQPCGFVMIIAAVMTLALEGWTRRSSTRVLLRKGGAGLPARWSFRFFSPST